MSISKAVSPGFIRDVIGQVEEGTQNPKDVKKIFAYYCSQRKRNKPIDDAVLEFIGVCFIKILRGARADKAFGLVQRRGRPNDTEDRNVFIAVDVLKKMNGGETLENAAVAVANNYHITESKIKDIYAKNKKMAEFVLRIGKLI